MEEIRESPTSPAHSGTPEETENYSPCKVILRFQSTDTSPKVNGRKQASVYTVDHSRTVLAVRNKQSYTLDGISMADTDCSEEFFDRYIRKSVEDAIVGEDRTIIAIGSSGTGKTHCLFSKDDGLAYKSLKQIAERQVDDIWNLLSSIAGATLGLSCVEVTDSEFLDLLEDETVIKSGKKRSKSRKYDSGCITSAVGITAGQITGAQVINSSDVELIWQKIHVATQDKSSKRGHRVVQLYVRPTGGRLTFIDMCGIENAPDMLGFEDCSPNCAVFPRNGWPKLKFAMEVMASRKQTTPFEDTQLNQLLREMLNGSSSTGFARTVMIVCASPKPSHVQQTVQILSFGAQVREMLLDSTEAKVAEKLAAAREKEMLQKQIKAKDKTIFHLQMQNKQLHAIIARKDQEEARRVLCSSEHAMAGSGPRQLSTEQNGSLEEVEVEANDISSPTLLHQSSMGGMSDRVTNVLREELYRISMSGILNEQRLAQKLLEAASDGASQICGSEFPFVAMIEESTEEDATFSGANFEATFHDQRLHGAEYFPEVGYSMAEGLNEDDDILLEQYSPEPLLERRRTLDFDADSDMSYANGDLDEGGVGQASIGPFIVCATVTSRSTEKGSKFALPKVSLLRRSV